MSTTATSDDSYLAVVNRLASGGSTIGTLRVRFDSETSDDLWKWEADGTMTFTEEVEARAKIVFLNREDPAVRPVVAFDNSSGDPAASMGHHGRWIAGEGGVILKVQTAMPMGSATHGAMRLWHQVGSPDKFWIILYLDGAWRKVELPN